MVRAPHSHAGGTGSVPGQGTKILCCAVKKGGGWSLCSRLEKPNTLIRSCTGRGRGGNKKKRQL